MVEIFTLGVQLFLNTFWLRVNNACFFLTNIIFYSIKIVGDTIFFTEFSTIIYMVFFQAFDIHLLSFVTGTFYLNEGTTFSDNYRDSRSCLQVPYMAHWGVIGVQWWSKYQSKSTYVNSDIYVMLPADWQWLSKWHQ